MAAEVDSGRKVRYPVLLSSVDILSDRSPPLPHSDSLKLSDEILRYSVLICVAWE